MLLPPIEALLRESLPDTLGRRGYVVCLSGGVDSSVCAALAARAVGPERVLGLALPERDSSTDSLFLAAEVATQLGIEFRTVDITSMLDAAGCYRSRDDAVRRMVPAYGEGWGCKLRIARGPGATGGMNLTTLVVRDPRGREEVVRLRATEYRQIVAATNWKQRVRAMTAYYHADALHYAVAGTANRLEFDQGFFVKGGDGLADVKPIAHLTKGEVFALASYLGLPAGVCNRAPTTDTFPLPQTQEEFYFRVDTDLLDALLTFAASGRTASEAAEACGVSEEMVLDTWADLAQKRAATRYLHLPPLRVDSSHPLSTLAD